MKSPKRPCEAPTHTCKSTNNNIDCQNFAFPKSHNDKVVGDSQLYCNISIYAILCIAFLICVFNPYALYATDITQFDSTQTIPTLCALFGVFLTTSFITIYATSFIPKRFAQIPAFVFSLALFIGLIYSFILVGDYGAMDHFILQKPPENSTQQILNFIAILAVGVIFIAFLLKRLFRLWQIILITLFIVSGANATNIIFKQVNFSIVSEKSGLRSHERGNRTSGSLTKRVASLHDLSPQDEFTIPPPICLFRANYFPTPKQRKIS